MSATLNARPGAADEAAGPRSSSTPATASALPQIASSLRARSWLMRQAAKALPARAQPVRNSRGRSNSRLQPG
jgi:hypothetical protein